MPKSLLWKDTLFVVPAGSNLLAALNQINNLQVGYVLMQRPNPIELNVYAMYSIAKSKRIAIKLGNELLLNPLVRLLSWCCFYNRVTNIWYMLQPIYPVT